MHMGARPVSDSDCSLLVVEFVHKSSCLNFQCALTDELMKGLNFKT